MDCSGNYVEQTSRLRDAAGREHELPGLLVVVASDEQTAMPMIDGKSVAVITPGEWARVPEPWIENRHRAGRESGEPAGGGAAA